MTVSFEIEPINDRIGAYVKVAVDDVLKEGMPEQIMDALNKYNMLVFPQVNMTDEQFVGLSDYYGEKHDLALTQDGSGQQAGHLSHREGGQGQEPARLYPRQRPVAHGRHHL